MSERRFEDIDTSEEASIGDELMGLGQEAQPKYEANCPHCGASNVNDSSVCGECEQKIPRMDGGAEEEE